MDMTRALALLLLIAAVHALPAALPSRGSSASATSPPGACGSTGEGAATLGFPDGKPVEYRGRETRLDFLKERAWRGTPAGDGKAVVVAFLRETACSDTMSDTGIPCRRGSPSGRAPAGGLLPIPALPLEGTTWQFTSPAALAPLPTGRGPPTVRFLDGRASGFSGCNRFTGGFGREGDTLTVGRLAGR